jgi:arginine metabolism regulation protein II
MPRNTPFGSLDGAPALTVFAITQIENLAEAIDESEMNNVPLSEYISEGIALLSSQLQEFRPDDNIPLFLSPEMDKQEIINNNLEVAWYLSTCIYYHNRINNTFIVDITFAVNGVLMCLLRAEEIKAQLQPELEHRDDPVTFPAFVACCNAVDRQHWASWWQAMQEYDSPKLRAQWKAIRIIWYVMDVTQEVGEVDLSWVDIMEGRDASLLSTRFEELGFR